MSLYAPFLIGTIAVETFYRAWFPLQMFWVDALRDAARASRRDR